jgi:hypothetical protein
MFEDKKGGIARTMHKHAPRFIKLRAMEQASLHAAYAARAVHAIADHARALVSALQAATP